MKKIPWLILILLATTPRASAQSVDLIWQGDSYSAPFYEGRTLWSREGGILLLAVPQGLGSSQGLEFSWRRNGTVLGVVSGIGRNTLSFKDTLFSKPTTIEVEIVENKQVIAKNSITLTPRSPFTAIYESNPLYGVLFHHEVGSGYVMDGEEITFAAFPLFFTTPSVEGSLEYRWNNELGKSLITYRAPDEVSGSSVISLTATNKDHFMQRVSRNFLVQFGTND